VEEKQKLLADISHDLKTPITTISGYATALLEGVIEDPAQEKQFLEAIRAKSLRMDELIMLLFEYVKLDSEGFTLNKEEVDIAELLRENVALLYTDFETNKMEIDMDIPDEGVMYSVDQVQFSRVIVNILNNAIRYNPPGTLISVKLFVEEGLRIKIADTGNVIEGDIASRIFEPFVTGDKSRNTRGGSGLGLSIAKKVVVMHGGDLILSIKEEKYTKAFVISLPKVR
jgi:signal transduction histidine kinase